MNDISELFEKLYLPTYWSKRLPADEILLKYIEVTKKLSEESKKNVPCDLGIPYGSSEKQKYDIFGTDLPNDAPIFIFIHGGYWQEEGIQRDTSSYMAESLYKHKCKTIVIGYTLCPHATLPQIIEEIFTAMRKCLSYAQCNNSKTVVIGGHSVGAHLAINLLPSFYSTLPDEQKQLITSIVLVAGIYDLTPLISTTINDPLKLDRKLAIELSPIHGDFESIKNGKVKIFIIVGEDDSPTFLAQSALMYTKLNGQDVDCDLQIYKELDHFDIVEKMDDDNYELVKLISVLCHINLDK